MHRTYAGALDTRNGMRHRKPSCGHCRWCDANTQHRHQFLPRWKRETNVERCNEDPVPTSLCFAIELDFVLFFFLLFSVLEGRFKRRDKGKCDNVFQIKLWGVRKENTCHDRSENTQLLRRRQEIDELNTCTVCSRYTCRTKYEIVAKSEAFWYNPTATHGNLFIIDLNNPAFFLRFHLDIYISLLWTWHEREHQRKIKKKHRIIGRKLLGNMRFLVRKNVTRVSISFSSEKST